MEADTLLGVELMKLEVVAATTSRFRGFLMLKATYKDRDDRMPESKTLLDRAESGGANVKYNDDPGETKLLLKMPGKQPERFYTLRELDFLRKKEEIEKGEGKIAVERRV